MTEHINPDVILSQLQTTVANTKENERSFPLSGMITLYTLVHDQLQFPPVESMFLIFSTWQTVNIRIMEGIALREGKRVTMYDDSIVKILKMMQRT